MELGISLSGGGIRAAAFHAGLLLRLAVDGRLEKVTRLSTVSGGSLFAAAVFSQAGYRWPSSSEYKNNVFPALRQLLTGQDLLSLQALGISGIIRFNARLLHSRANVLAQMLQDKWKIRGKLNDLPNDPIWWINTTCLETGKNWRFSRSEMGDWIFGRHFNPDCNIADAVAASAAVPYAIGALKLAVPQHGWYRTDPASKQPLEKRAPVSPVVRLWDGGAYENLGLEVLFKPGQKFDGFDFLICGDASAPLGKPSGTALNIFKGQLVSPRLFDISSDQIRALRSRMFMTAVQNGTSRGALIRMGNSVRDIDIKAGRQRTRSEYEEFQRDNDVALASTHPTQLRALGLPTFEHIARHGFEVTDATLTTYASSEFSQSCAWPLG